MNKGSLLNCNWHYGLLCFVFLILLNWRPTRAAVTKNSAPFDPFRLECPFYHGIIKLELRRVESAEGIRTDTMITAYCENVKKLYPSPRDRTTIANDENCRWTSVLKIPGKSVDVSATCSGREFMAGISRQAIGEYSILCCNLRDRKHGECTTKSFTWPVALTPESNVEDEKHLLTAVGFKDGQLIGQFCEFGIMTRQELDAELAANPQTLLFSQVGQDGIKQSNISRGPGTSGSVQQRISSQVREVESQPSSQEPSTSDPSESSDTDQSDPEETTTKKPQPTRHRPKISSPRPRSPLPSTPSTYEYEDGESTDLEKGVSHAGIVDVKNGVVRVINKDSDASDVLSDNTSPSPTSPPPRSTRSKTTTTTPAESTEPETITAEPTEVPTTTIGLDVETTAVEETTAPSTPLPTPKPTPKSKRKGPTTPAEPETTVEEESQTTTEKETLNDNGSEIETTAGPPSVTPAATKAGKRTKKPKTTEPPTTEEPETDLPPFFTAPDPSKFQVLGVPKPVGSKPLRPHGLFLQPLPGAPGKGPNNKKPGEGSSKAKGSSLAPAPPAKNGEESGDGQEEGTTRVVAANGIDLPTPPVPIGNLSAESGGEVINVRNASGGSAVAPKGPLFGWRIPLVSKQATKATTTTSTGNTEGSNGEITDRTTGSTGGTSEEGTSGATEGASQASLIFSASGPNGQSEFSDAAIDEANHVLCDTAHATVDNTTSLVVACGQGKDIWSPPRCPANTFCLVAKDSIFRICCPVRIG